MWRSAIHRRLSSLLEPCVLSLALRSQQQYLHRLVPNRPFTPGSQSFIYKVEDKTRYLQPILVWVKRKVLPLMTGMDPTQVVDTVFAPPETVRGMKLLDRKRFSRTVSVPCFRVKSQQIGAMTKSLKMSMFKMPRIKPVAELPDSDPDHKTHRLFLLDPTRYPTASDISSEEAEKLRKCNVDASTMSFYEIELGYENWTASEILRAVLPANSDGVSSYSIIGHIAHLNLKAEVMEFKHLIGEVILDKNHNVKTVVNKLNTIDNTFRNFQMELLAGEDNFVTRTKENGCTFELDFSKVYWNPRLSTEHQRVVDCLNQGDVLYDVFAGIGPFAIPAAKKGVTVLANDLNPHSHSALVGNIKLNKLQAELVQTFNMDGREFIRIALKQDLVSRLQTVAGSQTCSLPRFATHAQSGSREVTSVSSRSRDVTSVSGTNKNDVRECTEGSSAKDRAREEVCTDGTVEECPEESGSSTDQNTSKPQDVENLGSKASSAVQRTDGGTGDHIKSATSGEIIDCSISVEHKLLKKKYKISIVMNLPALAMEFLDAFRSLLSDVPQHLKQDPSVHYILPTVFCYCFSKSDDTETDVRTRAESILGHKLPLDAAVRLVRNVAPNKEMMCLIFRLTPEMVFDSFANKEDGGDESSNIQELAQEPVSKRQRVC